MNRAAVLVGVVLLFCVTYCSADRISFEESVDGIQH